MGLGTRMTTGQMRTPWPRRAEGMQLTTLQLVFTLENKDSIVHCEQEQQPHWGLAKQTETPQNLSYPNTKYNYIAVAVALQQVMSLEWHFQQGEFQGHQCNVYRDWGSKGRHLVAERQRQSSWPPQGLLHSECGKWPPCNDPSEERHRQDGLLSWGLSLKLLIYLLNNM